MQNADEPIAADLRPSVPFAIDECTANNVLPRSRTILTDSLVRKIKPHRAHKVRYKVCAAAAGSRDQEHGVILSNPQCNLRNNSSTATSIGPQTSKS